jgi:hypothetical protein
MELRCRHSPLWIVLFFQMRAMTPMTAILTTPVLENLGKDQVIHNITLIHAPKMVFS